MEYYSVIKKNEILPLVDNMDGPQEHYTKWNKSERERQIPYNVSYKWTLKKKAQGYREQIGGWQRWG